MTYKTLSSYVAAIPGIDKEIYQLGSDVLNSSYLTISKQQIHHHRTTLYQHTIEVTRAAAEACNALEAHGIRINRKDVILGALCHDLGMVGRDEKFKSSVQSCLQHPKDSAEIASELLPDMDEEFYRIIRKHMWPLCFSIPCRREEWIVILADKKISILDIMGMNH